MKTLFLSLVSFTIAIACDGGNFKHVKQSDENDLNIHIKAIAEGLTETWFGTDNGAYCINRKTNVCRHFTKENSMLPSNIVTSICCSKDGNIWIGTNNGILRFDNYAYVLMNSENTGLPDNHITAITLDKDNILWIGTYFGGLTCLRNFKYTVYNHTNSALPTDCIFSLSSDSKGNVWAGLFCNGLVKIKGNEWQFYNSTNSTLHTSNVSFVIEEGRGQYTIGGYDSGMFAFNNGIFTKIENSINSNLRFVCTDNYTNKKYVGSDQGVYIMHCLSEKTSKPIAFNSFLNSEIITLK